MANRESEPPVSVFNNAQGNYKLGGINHQPFMRDWEMIQRIDPENLNGDREKVSATAEIIVGAMTVDLDDLVRHGFKKIVQKPGVEFVKKDPVGALEETIFILSKFIIDPEDGDLPNE